MNNYTSVNNAQVFLLFTLGSIFGDDYRSFELTLGDEIRIKDDSGVLEVNLARLTYTLHSSDAIPSKNMRDAIVAIKEVSGVIDGEVGQDGNVVSLFN